ncbi:MAG: efflux RND transporter periplasmic adaptor subunit [Hyphomicrobiaceae bacterium]|nr:efflux RND transporter periplasmic adaptor subunit [Hyphomicrobiaceae bacterium]
MASLLLRTLPLLLAGVIGGFVVWLLGGHGGDAPNPAVHLVSNPASPVGLPVGGAGYVAVTEMPAAARVKLGGYVESHDHLQLTAQDSGRITFIGGDAGDRVTAGQIVISLDEDMIGVDYRQAWAALTGEMANVQNRQLQLYFALYGQQQSPIGGPAYSAYDRSMTPFFNIAQSMANSFFPGMFGGQNTPMLSSGQRMPGPMYDARAAYEAAQANLAAAQARIDALDQRLRNRRSIAPYSATILKRYVELGDIVQPGQPLADLADTDRLDVRIEVPTNLIAHLKLGDQIPVSLDHENVWAAVSQIYPAADPQNRTVTVKLSLPTGAAAAPGMYVVAWLAQESSQSETAAAIPVTAIDYRAGLPVAFVATSDGSTQMRVLRLGDITGDQIAVLSGLTPGEYILANPGLHTQTGGDAATGH